MIDMKHFSFRKLAVLLPISIGLTAGVALAEIKFEDEETGIKARLGGRLQTQFIVNDSQFDNDTEFKVRRARVRFGITPTEMVDIFLQTEFQNEAGPSSGGDVRLIDAFSTIKPDNWLQLVAGLRMAPASRQITTSSGALLAFDRPGITNYALTWGLRGQGALQNRVIPGTKGGSLGDTAVRDLGATLFGSGSFSDNVHGKYYVSYGEGSVEADDTDRFTTRVQFNFGDAESGYYNSASYLGKKQTVGLGFSYDMQDDIAASSLTGMGVDYDYYSFDLFAEQAIGPGSWSAEFGYSALDLNDTMGSLATFGDGTSLGVSGMQVQGEGYYFQTAYYINNWQPFFLVESWDADAAGDAGDWMGYRAGLAYFLKGHNAAIKIAYERIDNDTVGVPDKIDTVSTGIFVTF